MRMDGETDGQTDRHDKANRRFSQFFESTWKQIHTTHNTYRRIKKQIFKELPSLLRMDYLSSQIDNDIILIAQIVHLQFTYLLLCLYIFIVMYVAFWVFCLTVLFCLLFVCKCVLYCCQRVTTHLLLKNISYHIIKREIYWKSVFFFCYKFYVFFFLVGLFYKTGGEILYGEA